jgi:DNA-binding PadR family transcriptional regulator
MTLNEALILSYVKRGIGYGYSILNHVKKSRSDEWVDFSRAGLYKTLEKLEKNGFVKKTLKRSGGRPPQKVYNITLTGEKALSDFLNDGFNFNFLTKNDLDAYLVTAVAASPDSKTLAVKVGKRIDAVRNHLNELNNDWPEEKDSYPLIVYALYKRRMESLEHELKWLLWLEDILNSISGDVLHMTWGEAHK